MGYEELSIDMGNGYFKGLNSMGANLHYPSIVKPKTDANVFNEGKDDFLAIVNGKEYYFGQLAARKGGIRPWSNTNSLNPDYELHAALAAHVLLSGRERDIKLLIGLPFSMWQSQNRLNDQSLKKRFIGKSFQTEYDNEVKDFRIVDISIFPQGVGAYMSNLYGLDGNPIDEEAEDQISAIFIEIGYKTVEYVAFQDADNGWMLDAASGSLENSGSYRICEDIRDLMGDMGNKYNCDDIEYAINYRNGILTNIDGKIDVKDLERQTVAQLANEISNQINQRFSATFAKYANIYVSGGAAAKFYPEMKKYFSQLKLQKDPVFANARGYMAIENHNKFYE